ncbi:P-loop containing nucleoside triphosphate hydrolase protein [Catenaria anguillulae PL171]|uniref:ATP-dependent RNA helicase n=1 Tax=Catenaria anguillulae PL171 TaxID=765915 RepID=A0A1Y2HYN5_9FUNG|nr:P-loop containing nucleoside triphosphate hydrolase protein [Catenaria anguillulae PL171]
MIRAPTGSGKTLAFLAPALTHLSQPTKARSGPKVLILSPTRELAQQTRREAEILVKNAPGALGKIVIAGAIPEPRTSSAAALRDKPVDWLATGMVVATPGKLLEVLSQHPRILSNVDMLILDEADRMLDSNFEDQVSTILAHLPANRQTLLLSATYSAAIRSLAVTSLRPGFHAVSTIPTTDATPLNSIRQFYSIASMAAQPALLHALIHRSVLASATSNAPPLKAMVFLPTVALTTLYASLFTSLFTPAFLADASPTASKRLPTTALPPILAMHSDLSPAARARVASAFSASSSGILFTSDVSARGMDYAGVHLVVQVGMPASLDTYVHRVGRTGRAGRTDGVALAIVAPFERAVALEQVSGVGVVEAEVVNGCVEGIGVEQEGQGVTKVKWDGASSARLVRVAVAKGAVGEEEVKAAYLGMLGYYENHLPKLIQSGLSSYTVVKELDAFATTMGLKMLPKLPQGLRAAFGDAQEMTVDKRVKVQGKAMAKAGVGAGVSKKLLQAAEKQHKNNRAKVLAGTKRRRPLLDNEFAYRRDCR